MSNVAVGTTYPLVTGSGSVGVAFGSDANPAQQAITGEYSNVTVREYDICFHMRYYSNANLYRRLSAMRTNNAIDPASAGFKVDGRGGNYVACHCESNFDAFLDETNIAEENVYTGFWIEGVSTGEINLLGQGSYMIAPYGFVGGAGGAASLKINKGANATVLKKKPGAVTVAAFSGQGENLVQNADFAIGLGGLNWGSYVTPSGNTIFGHKSLQVRNTGPATTISVDHLMTYIDLNVHTWLRGKTISMACFGQAASGVNMTIRGVIRNAGGSNIQYATSEVFDTAAPGLRKISINIPEDAADARYIVFRIYCSGVTSGSPSIGGEIAMPMVYLGNDIMDVRARSLSDGANTLYGNQTLYGGGWDGAHLVLGSHHLWVDSTGDLRIKSSTPTSDTDGTVVGTQT